MAEHSLNELVKLINYHMESLEKQTHYFGMMNALTEVALDGAFLNQSQLVSHYYLRAVSEILDKASAVNEASLTLLRQCVQSHQEMCEA